jgi:hypothetical protein
MQKIINELINNSLKGVDTYRWHDSTWLIFSEEFRWVIELTDGGTLWFNYKFFDNVLRYVSLNPNEGSKYITAWAESHFFRKNDGWKVFDSDAIHRLNKTVTVVNRGVKKTEGRGKNHGDEFEWHTRAVVDNGIKDVKPNVVFHGVNKSSMSYVPCSGNVTDIWMIVDEGIKNTYPDMNPNDYDWSDEFKADNVIQGGIKVIPLPTIKDLRGYSDYYNTKEDKTKPHTEYVKDAIEGGVKL